MGPLHLSRRFEPLAADELPAGPRLLGSGDAAELRLSPVHWDVQPGSYAWEQDRPEGAVPEIHVLPELKPHMAPGLRTTKAELMAPGS